MKWRGVRNVERGSACDGQVEMRASEVVGESWREGDRSSSQAVRTLQTRTDQGKTNAFVNYSRCRIDPQFLFSPFTRMCVCISLRGYMIPFFYGMNMDIVRFPCSSSSYHTRIPLTYDTILNVAWSGLTYGNCQSFGLYKPSFTTLFTWLTKHRIKEPLKLN